MKPEEIKALRKKHRLTRYEFGQLVYQTERSVKGWECNERELPKALEELILYKLEGIEPPKNVWYNELQEEMSV